MGGFVADSLLFSIGKGKVYPVACSQIPGTVGPDPLFMVSLWIGFGAFVDWAHVLFSGRPSLCLALGLVFGPLAYMAGSKLGALVVVQSGALFMVAIEYGICFPILVAAAGWSLGKIQ